jgi:7-cyano-7-deazaguanine synthase
MSVEGLFFDYGQPAARWECAAARAIAAHLDIPLYVITMQGMAKHEAGEVIGRNAFLIFGAIVLRPWSRGVLAIGVHSGTAYFDCSPTFLEGMTTFVAEHTDGALKLLAPFVTWSKKQVYDYFITEKLPIGVTHSCEAGGAQACNTCNSCRDRIALGC